VLVTCQYIDELSIVLMVVSADCLDTLILQLISSHTFVFASQDKQSITILNSRNETYTSVATVRNSLRIEQVWVKSLLTICNSSSRV